MFDVMGYDTIEDEEYDDFLLDLFDAQEEYNGDVNGYTHDSSYFNYDMDKVINEDNGGQPARLKEGIQVAHNMGTDKLRKDILSIVKKPYYDFNTNNKSFLDVYNDLYKAGIKNCKFFLKLYDKDLLGIDPYNQLLSLEMQLKICYECIINPWYYVREIARIPEDGVEIKIGGGVQFRLDKNNLACGHLFFNGIDNYVSKPRQRGKTQSIITFLVYAYHFGTLSTHITFGNKSAIGAKENLARFKDQRDMIPEWMQMKNVVTTKKTKKGVDNITNMYNPITNNKIKVLPSAISQASATRIGRGDTTAIQWWDEFDFIPYNTDIIDASSFAYQTASQNAAKNHGMYGRLFSSTPGDLDDKSGATAAEFVGQMLVWEDKFFDQDIEWIRKASKAEKRSGIVFVEHSWRQLKLDNSWYEMACRSARFNPVVVAREIELRRIRGSSKSPFDQNVIMRLSNQRKDPIGTIEIGENYEFAMKMYKVLDRKTPYIVSVDPAEGLSLDHTAVSIINPYTELVDAEFQSNYISPPKFVSNLIEFMDRYCPKCLIVVENNRGREIINRLLESKYASRVWYDSKKLAEVNKRVVGKYGLEYEAEKRSTYGFANTRTTRPLLFGVLDTIVQERLEIIFTSYVVDDICKLERGARDKVAAASGEHDDNIMSYLIGMYILWYAPNLREFGIRLGEKPKEVITEELKSNPVEYAKVLKDLYSAIPDDVKNAYDLQEIDVVGADPLLDSYEHEKAIQEALGYHNGDVFGDLEDVTQNADSRIFDNLYQHRQNYNNSNSGFDIDDYI